MEAVGNLKRILEENRAHRAEVESLLDQDLPDVCPECGQTLPSDPPKAGATP